MRKVDKSLEVLEAAAIPIPPSWDWILLSDSYSAEGGILGLLPASRGKAEALASAALRRISIDSLAYGADLIVLGENLGKGVLCAKYGKQGPCLRFKVDRVLLGEEASREIPVYSLITGDVPRGRGILFLRKKAGAYELVRVSAGGKPVANGLVGREKRPLSEIISLVSRHAKTWRKWR